DLDQVVLVEDEARHVWIGRQREMEDLDSTLREHRPVTEHAEWHVASGRRAGPTGPEPRPLALGREFELVRHPHDDAVAAGRLVRIGAALEGPGVTVGVGQDVTLKRV